MPTRHFEAPPRNISTREKELITSRWRLLTEYALSYGQGREELSAEHKTEMNEKLNMLKPLIHRGELSKLSLAVHLLIETSGARSMAQGRFDEEALEKAGDNNDTELVEMSERSRGESFKEIMNESSSSE